VASLIKDVAIMKNQKKETYEVGMSISNNQLLYSIIGNKIFMNVKFFLHEKIREI